MDPNESKDRRDILKVNVIFLVKKKKKEFKTVICDINDIF